MHNPFLELPSLVSQSSLPESEVQPVLASLIQQGKIIEVSEGKHHLLFTASGWEQLAGKSISILGEYHHRFSMRTGMPRVEMGSRLQLGVYAPVALQKLLKQEDIVADGSSVRLPGHQVKLNPAQQAKIEVFLKSLAQSPYAPPGDLIPEPDLLTILVEQDKVVKVSENVVFAATTYQEMVARVTAYIKAHGKISLAEVRDMFQTSRKYAQSFLEHLDGEKITRRIGDERVLL